MTKTTEEAGYDLVQVCRHHQKLMYYYYYYNRREHDLFLYGLAFKFFQTQFARFEKRI